MAFKIYCPNCDRYICETEETLIAKNIKCGGCKQKINIKFVSTDSKEEEIRYDFNKK